MRTLKKIFYEFIDYIEFIVIYFPGRVGNFSRKIYWKSKLNFSGSNLYVGSETRFFSPHLVEIGNNVQIGSSIIIDASDSEGIKILDNVAIAHGSYLRSANHNFDNIDQTIQSQGHSAKSIEFENNFHSIVIESDVWIGANAVILSGSHVGKGSVISAGAIISSKIPPYSIVVGNPGRVIGNRKKNLEKKSNEL